MITKGGRACPVCGTLFPGEFCSVCALRGSYGDILVRDRKMYVAPTPFALAEGTAHRRMLILPADHSVDNSLVKVGLLIRSEVDQVVVAYSFDLRTNNLGTTLVANPNAGREHAFNAYRVADEPLDPVSLRERTQVIAELVEAEISADEGDKG